GNIGQVDVGELPRYSSHDHRIRLIPPVRTERQTECSEWLQFFDSAVQVAEQGLRFLPGRVLVRDAEFEGEDPFPELIEADGFDLLRRRFHCQNVRDRSELQEAIRQFGCGWQRLSDPERVVLAFVIDQMYQLHVVQGADDRLELLPRSDNQAA